MARRSPSAALAAAGLGVLGLLACWVLAFRVGPTRTADLRVLEGFDALERGPIDAVSNVVPHLSDPQPFALTALVILGVALLRRRPRLALASAFVLLGANFATQQLKPALAEGRVLPDGVAVGAAAWPSGHATASMSLCLCAILVCPARLRPFAAALGAVYSLAVTFTLLVEGWHFPSDVIAGYLMAGTWTAVAVAAVWAAERRWPVTAARPARLGLRAALAPALAVAVAAGVLVALVVLARPEEVELYARQHTTFVLGAGVIAALALALAAGLSVAMTTTRPAPRRW